MLLEVGGVGWGGFAPAPDRWVGWRIVRAMSAEVVVVNRSWKHSMPDIEISQHGIDFVDLGIGNPYPAGMLDRIRAQ
jgi:phage major head subunit gpT-like protein